MGRKRSKPNRYLPPRMHPKGKAFYLVTKQGQKRIWTPLGSDYAEACRKYGELVPMEPSPGRTFGDLAAEYLKTEFFQKLRPATRASYTLALGNLINAFGDAPVRLISAGDVGQYMDLRSSIHSANREKAVLSKILNLGVRWGWCDENVAKKIEYHSTQRRKRIITKAEFSKIKLAAKNDLVPVFMDLAFMTGLRVGDLLSLQWQQVTEEGIHVLQGKNNVEGIYEITDSLQLVLDRAKRLHKRDGKVRSLIRPETTIIHKRNLGPYTYYGFRSIWRRVVEKAKLPDIHIHDIRRTAITAAKQTGIRPIDFSLHRTESEANEYVIEVPKVKPLDPM